MQIVAFVTFNLAPAYSTVRTLLPGCFLSVSVIAYLPYSIDLLRKMPRKYSMSCYNFNAVPDVRQVKLVTASLMGFQLKREYQAKADSIEYNIINEQKLVLDFKHGYSTR